MTLRRLLILSLLVLSAGCSSSSDTAGPQGGPPAVPVRIGLAQKRDLPVYLEAVGHLRPSSHVEITALVEGELAQCRLPEGSLVAKGEILYEIASTRYQATLEGAQAELSRHEAELAHARTRLERHAGLLEKKFVTPSLIDELKKEVEVFAALVKADRARIAIAQLDLDQCLIRAPIDGVLGKREIHSGNTVKVGTLLTTLVQRDPLIVEFHLSERHLASLKRANLSSITLECEVEGQPSVEGVLSFVNPTINPASGTVALRGLLPTGQGLLHPGQFAKVYVRLEDIRDALTVPKEALQMSEEGPFLFALGEEGVVRQVQVATGYNDGESVVVTGELQPGDQVVIEGQLLLYPNAKAIPL